MLELIELTTLDESEEEFLVEKRKANRTKRKRDGKGKKKDKRQRGEKDDRGDGTRFEPR